MRKEPAVELFVRIKKNTELFEKALSKGDREKAVLLARDSAALYRRLAEKIPLRELEYIGHAKEWELKIEDMDTPRIDVVQTLKSENTHPIADERSQIKRQPHKVFISYASPDRAIALSVCSHLESNEIPCWISPRDILPGTHYPSSIIRAIDECVLIVLICSRNSNKSLHVFRELEEAIIKDIAILPFRIDDNPLSEDMRYLINIHHWLDAFDNPAESYFDSLLDSVRSLLPKCAGKPEDTG